MEEGTKGGLKEQGGMQEVTFVFGGEGGRLVRVILGELSRST